MTVHSTPALPTLPPADDTDVPDVVEDLHTAPDAEAHHLPEGVRKRLMAVLFSSQSVFSAAQIVAFTPMPLAAVALTANEATAGWPSTISLVGRALIAYPVGWMMDRLGRRLGVSLGLFASVIGTLTAALALVAGSFPLFLIGSLVNGFGRGASEQSRYVAADIRPGAQAAKAIGAIVFAGTIGAVVGPLLIGPSEQFALQRGLPELSGPYFLTSALTFIAFALIFLFLRPEPQPLRTAGEPKGAAASGRPLREIFALPAVQFAVAALAISQLVMTMVMVITPLHMQHSGHNTGDISLVIMAHTLGMFGLSSLTGWLSARIGRMQVVILAGLTLAVSAVIAPFADTVPLLALALFLLGLGWNFGFVAGSALLAAAVPGNERGRTQGASETLVAAAAALGSFGSGFAFLWGGMIAVSAIGLALALVMLAARLIWRESPAEQPELTSESA